MKIRRLLTGIAIGAALVVVSPANAGGSFTQIVGVGTNGTWLAIDLQARGARSEDAFYGPRVPVPRGGFVRVYPTIGGLPGDPGRYYPTHQVLCLYWREPVSNCGRLGSAGIDLLSPLAKLPLRHRTPTTPVELRYRSRLLRHFGSDNVLAAIELALERPPVRRSSPPGNAVRLAVRWSGPRASRMPSVVELAPHGVYSSHRFYGLTRWTWCYLAVNLPHAPVALLEATDRICR